MTVFVKSISGSLKSFLAENQDLKYLGEKAFVSYVRSLYLEKDKEVMNFFFYQTCHFEP